MVSISQLSQFLLGIGKLSDCWLYCLGPFGLHAPKDYQFSTKERKTKQNLE